MEPDALPEAALSEAAGGGVGFGAELVEGAFDFALGPLDFELGAFDLPLAGFEFELGALDFELGPFDLVDAEFEEPADFSACPPALFSPAGEP